MKEVLQDMSPLIADEIAEHFRGARLRREPQEVGSLRFHGLNRILTEVLEALKSIGLLDSVRFGTPVDDDSREIECNPITKRERTLIIELRGGAVSFKKMEARWSQYEDLRIVPNLYWDRSINQWFGPRLGRNLDAPGAPWVRESPEAELTRAVLRAIVKLDPDDEMLRG